MPTQIAFRLPFASRKAAESFRDQVVEHLLHHKLPAGSRFPTEAELVSDTGLSRSTIRRGLHLLREEGWVLSRAGSGTVVGEKAAQLTGHSSKLSVLSTEMNSRRSARLAIVVFEIRNFLGSWYWREIISGIDEVAEKYQIVLELIGDPGSDLQSVQRRLEQSKPNLVACMGSESRHVFVARMAALANIPCAVVGTTVVDVGGIRVCEDNAQITSLALKQLTDCGHRRIGLIISRQMHGWVFERHKAYYDYLRSAGLDETEGLVHWIDPVESVDESKAHLEKFLTRREPTGLMAGSFSAMDFLARLFSDGRVRIPEQLSVVSIDQFAETASKVEPVDLTRIELPLRQIGGQLARLTSMIVRSEPLPTNVMLPGTLHTGNSIRSIREE